jgi:hypothetical protein
MEQGDRVDELSRVDESDRVDEAGRVLTRLGRIEALNRSQADPGVVLGELRALVGEAEAWARLEGDERARGAARAAAQKLRGDAEGMR